VIHRGDVWWADLGVSRGSAPALRRPVVIISSDRYNRSQIRTVTVIVLTRNRRLASMPGNVLVPADVAGLPDDSVVNITQVSTIDRSHLDVRIGALPTWCLSQVEAGLALALDFPAI
jgi:mRNA interferase MazF